MFKKFTLALFFAGLPINALAECPSLNEADATIVLANLCKTKTIVSRAFLEQAKDDLVAFGKQLKNVVNTDDFKSLREIGSRLPAVSKRIEELRLLKSGTKEQRDELTILLDEAARIKNARNTLVQSWVRRIVNPEMDIYLPPCRRHISDTQNG